LPIVSTKESSNCTLIPASRAARQPLICNEEPLDRPKHARPQHRHRAAEQVGLVLGRRNPIPGGLAVDAARIIKDDQAMERVPTTAEGLKVLEDELKQLKSVERPAIIKAIAAAREHGDLSENAEYTSARERQGFIEGRIAEIEDIISRAEVIDFSKLSGKIVKFGATVSLADEDTDEKVKYQIVGPYEADLAKRRISVTSPIGRALIGKTVGDTVEVQTPRGARSYEVVGVQFK
jgi:transcription elongation factor GreA